MKPVQLATVGAIFVIGLLAACTSPGADPPGASDSPDASGPSAWVEQVGPDGLIDGKSVYDLINEAHTRCMEDAGWPELETGGWNVPPEQEDQWKADEAECRAQGEEAYPITPPTDRALREQYGYELELRECLIAQGYDISEPPSEQTWVEWVNGTTVGLWSPYWEVITETNISRADLAALKLKCPDPSARYYAP